MELIKFFYSGSVAEQARKAEGSRWKISFHKVGGKQWRVTKICEDNPAANSVDVHEEDVEQCVNSAVLGKAKVTLTRPNARTLKIRTEPEVLDAMEITHEFSDAGCQTTNDADGGAHFKHALWHREVDEEGYFRYVGEENASKMMEVMLGMPGADFGPMAEGAMQRWVSLGGDAWLFTEKLIGHTKVMKVRLDEEGTYDIPGYERKSFSTRLAPGKIKTILTNPETGAVEEWIKEVDCRGNMTWHGYDPVTGTRCKHLYERYTCLDGSWRPVHAHDMDKFGVAFGMPASAAKAMAEETDYEIRLQTMPDGSINETSTSKVLPYTMNYTLGEEFEFKEPASGTVFNCITTASGDTYTQVHRGGGQTFKYVSKVSKNFLVMDFFLEGSDVKAKVIFMRT